MAAPLLSYLGETMVSFTGHDGSEPVISSKSPDPGRIVELPKGSAPVTPHMSPENNGSSLLVSGQSKAVRLRLLPSIIPGRPPIFVNEKRFEPILRLRARRVRVNAGIRKPSIKNRHPRGSTGCSIEAKGKQESTNPGISQAPSSIPAVDLCGPFIATDEDEEHVGEAAYESILNLKAPDFTDLLRIMMEDKYNTDVTKEFKSVARLESPDFTTLLTVMNNASYDESTDDGYYCVDKVKLKLSGWL